LARALIINNRTLLVLLMTMLKLICCVRGDDFLDTFAVNINEDNNVCELKNAIKERKRLIFDDIPADSLRLWKVSVPINRDLKNGVKALNLLEDDMLVPHEILSEIFMSDLERKNVHIIIRKPEHSGE
jgi:hypothetical protein